MSAAAVNGDLAGECPCPFGGHAHGGRPSRCIPVPRSVPGTAPGSVPTAGVRVGAAESRALKPALVVTVPLLYVGNTGAPEARAGSLPGLDFALRGHNITLTTKRWRLAALRPQRPIATLPCIRIGRRYF